MLWQWGSVSIRFHNVSQVAWPGKSCDTVRAGAGIGIGNCIENIKDISSALKSKHNSKTSINKQIDKIYYKIHEK